MLHELGQLFLAKGVREVVIFLILLAVAFIFGRIFCGKICPAGFVQDLLHLIPFPVKIKTFAADKKLRYIKYILLLLPVTMSGQLKTITLPREALLAAFFLFVVSCVTINRPFCKYFCSRGAMLSVGCKFTSYKYHFDTDKCNQCGSCARSCKMDIVPYKQVNILECIHCGKCVRVCPEKAFSFAPPKP
jgi:polyferredoxin